MAERSPKKSPQRPVEPVVPVSEDKKVKSTKKVQSTAKKEKSEIVPEPQPSEEKQDGRPSRRTRTQPKEQKSEQKNDKKAPQLQQEEPKLLKKHQKLGESHDIQQLQDIAHQLRIHSLEMTQASNSGHPTSCSSMAELMSVLFMDQSGIHYNPTNPRSFTSDRFVLSKGHAAPILYAAWSVAGLIDPSTLTNLRKIDCDLEGHPTPRLPFVDVATGSLGQGVSVAGGMAYTSKYLDKIDNRYWVLCGDGEIAEGSVWEACNLASHYKLDNLTVIVDVNRLGQSQETLIGHDIDVYRHRFESFGFATFKVDGHNLYEIIETFEKCRTIKGQPQAILAKTFKGKYFEGIEDKLDWHGKPLGVKTGHEVDHIKSLQKTKQFTIKPKLPENPDQPYPELPNLRLGPLNYIKGQQKVSTRKAYGTALVNLSHSDVNKQLISLDGDVKNSTFAITYKEAVPTNFIECFIAEQNLVGWAQGVACRNKIAFVSTFGAFFSRAYDQIRMGGISRSQVKFAGSHCGVSIGEDGNNQIINNKQGPSQMALEDIAMFRAIPNALVLYPSDAVSSERAIEIAANYRGPVYIRTSRPDTDIIYNNDEIFQIGQSKVIANSNNDELLIIGAGVTLHEALNAQNTLKLNGIQVAVIDLFSVKPFDKQTVLDVAQKTRKRLILTVEDHYIEGGIYETVAGALAFTDIKVASIAVNSIPRSGKPQELLQLYGLDSLSIQKKVKELLA